MATAHGVEKAHATRVSWPGIGLVLGISGAVLLTVPNVINQAAMIDPFVYTGLISTFQSAGFVETLRRSETRPIMRYAVNSRKDK